MFAWVPSAPASKQPSRPSRSGTASLAATRSGWGGELVGCRLSTGTIDAIVQGAGGALAEPQARLSGHVRSASVVRDRRDRLAPARQQTHALGRAHRAGGALSDRPRPPRARGQGDTRRGLRGDRLLRSLVGLQLPRPRAPPGLLVTPDPRLQRPKRRTRTRAELREGRTRDRRAPLLGLARLPTRRRPRPADRAGGAAAARTEDTPRTLRRQSNPSTNAAAGSPPTCSRSGRHCRPSPRSTASSQPINRAERGLRGAVIYRKLSLGSQSEHGEQTIERLLPASHTCRLQQRSLFAYLTDVLAAKARGEPRSLARLTANTEGLNAYCIAPHRSRPIERNGGKRVKQSSSRRLFCAW